MWGGVGSNKRVNLKKRAELTVQGRAISKVPRFPPTRWKVTATMLLHHEHGSQLFSKPQALQADLGKFVHETGFKLALKWGLDERPNRGADRCTPLWSFQQTRRTETNLSYSEVRRFGDSPQG